MSGLVSRSIGTWRPGVYTNITADYTDRVQTHINGSMGLSDLRLQDAGFYVLTVTDTAGNSKDAGFVLKVNGEFILVCTMLEMQIRLNVLIEFVARVLFMFICYM